MEHLILAVNAGSSSLKISLYTLADTHSGNDEPVILKINSTISAISSPPATFSFKSIAARNKITEQVEAITDHASAFDHFLRCLERIENIDKSHISHICHRVVHGGEYSQPVAISEKAYHHIKNLSDLAPLHNGAALSVIQACIATLPTAQSIAYFDTAFHRSIPAHISTYAINQEVAKPKGLKKYGFHGLSYAFILRSVSRFLQKPQSSLNLIVLHLGSGASACAIRNGLSLDTSMGLTPLCGLPGATRSGSVDPSLIFHFTNKASRITHSPDAAALLHVTKAEHILNKQSGWKALTGTTDFGIITARAEQDEPNNPYRLAYDLFVDRILDFVGSYFVKLGGRVDALVFSGGIGEHSDVLRKAVGDQVRCLGFAEVDMEKNSKASEGETVVDIGVERRDKTDGRILVCKTDEQFEMARECAMDAKWWKRQT